MNSTARVSVLFVCLGNICRSPTAHAVFRQLVKTRNLDIEVDSCGTIGYHAGDPPDRRAKQAGESRGYDFSELFARQVTETDFAQFDYVLAMDNQNLRDLVAICPSQYQHKVQLFLSYSDADADEVPDPYYGGADGFEYVLDLVEEASENLVEQIVKNHRT